MVDHARDWLMRPRRSAIFPVAAFDGSAFALLPATGSARTDGAASLDASRARYLNSYWNRGDVGASRLQRHREDIVALYDAGIRWVDAQVARLVDTLRGLGLWENCVMALTADHGEEFLDHGGRYHPPSNVAEELVRVPLLLRAPGLPQTGIVAAPFSLLHLAPTLLDLVEVPVPGSFRGRSHAELAADGQELGERCGCRMRCRMHESLCGGKSFAGARAGGARGALQVGARFQLGDAEQLFDLEADPGELRPLPPDAEKAVRRRLLDRARQHLSDSLQSRDADHRMAARLRDLRLEWASPAVRKSV